MVFFALSFFQVAINSGEPLTPSCVSFSNDTKEVFVGDLAVSKKSSDYEHTIYGNVINVIIRFLKNYHVANQQILFNAQ